MISCRRCPAPIFFAVQNPTEKQKLQNKVPKPNPINLRPHPEGNLRVDTTTNRYDVLTGDALAEARAKREPLYLSHFVDCPNRQQFKKAAG